MNCIEAEKKFKCNMCGKCCSSNGVRQTKLKEILKIKNYLKLSFFYFARFSFLHGFYIKSTEKGCIFLQDKICTIHQVKPLFCESFPYRWENEIDIEKHKKEYPFCNGFDN